MELDKNITMHSHKGWVSDDGSFGVGSIIVFDGAALTDRQWEVMYDLGDSAKFEYVEAIMNGDPTDEWEE